MLNDAQGQPVSGAEVAVVVVDEAILALSNYQLADPISIFYYAIRPSDTDQQLRARQHRAGRPAGAGRAKQQAMQLDKAEQGLAAVEEAAMEAPAAAPMPSFSMWETASGRAQPQPAIRVRTDFNPLAVFAPTVLTGARRERPGDGQAAR